MYIACQELGIKYATANNIVKLYMQAMDKGQKSLPRPKDLDIIGSSSAIKNNLPSFNSIVSEIGQMKERGEYENQENMFEANQKMWTDIHNELEDQSKELRRRFPRRHTYEPRKLKTPMFLVSDKKDGPVIDLTLIESDDESDEDFS